jgi:predicted metal-dependent enzyme (double-stranded beta helix superfamily)
VSQLDALPARDLGEAELSAVVADVAAERELWAEFVRGDAERRTYVELHADEHVSIWLICWMDGHDTGFHDHDGSAGALTVVSGALREERLRFGVPTGHTLRAGDGLTFAPSAIHRVAHARGEPAVSLHAYSPPLRSMGSYAVDDDGELRRLALGDDEELRPLSAALTLVWVSPRRAAA